MNLENCLDMWWELLRPETHLKNKESLSRSHSPHLQHQTLQLDTMNHSPSSFRCFSPSIFSAWKTTTTRYRHPGNLLAFEVDFITAELQHLNVLEEVEGCLVTLVFNTLPPFLLFFIIENVFPFRISEFQSEKWRLSRRWGLVSCNWN